MSEQFRMTFLKTRIVKDGKQGTPEETKFVEGETYSFSERSAFRWLKRGLAVPAGGKSPTNPADTGSAGSTGPDERFTSAKVETTAKEAGLFADDFVIGGELSGTGKDKKITAADVKEALKSLEESPFASFQAMKDFDGAEIKLGEINFSAESGKITAEDVAKAVAKAVAAKSSGD